jgi:pimeloyl-ACP methyl ester carboxylesterase
MSVVFKSPEAGEAVRTLYRRVLDGWPTPHDETRVATRQGETFVLSCGPKDAPPLVLLHGAQANIAAWAGDAAVWAGRFRVHAIDMIGEAGFSAEARPSLDDDTHAQWLDEVLDGLGVARAAFVGVSLGGWLALDYAMRRPARVERLALLCPAGIGAQKNFLAVALPLMLLGPWGMKKVRELVFGPAPENAPEGASAFVELMGAINRAIKPRVVKIPTLSDAALAALPSPMLVIVGGRDVMIDSAQTRDRLARAKPDAQVVFLPEGRHFIPGQTERILDFLCGP